MDGRFEEESNGLKEFNTEKQYFEQRRRQKHQLIAGLESFDGGGNKWGEHSHKEHKSLDILNLLNFSTSSHESKHDYSDKREQKVNASTVKYPIITAAPIIQASTVTPAVSVEINKASSSSDSEAETLSLKKVLPGSLDNHSNYIDGVDKKPDPWNAATQQQISVFDLLADDESNGYLEEGPIHEAHVAFSVDGMGKVGTETPPRTPQRPDRHVSYGCFSLLKTAAQLNPSRKQNSMLNDLELEDTIMQDLEMPLSGSSLKFSTGIVDSYCQKKNLHAETDHVQLDSHGSKVRSSFSHGQAFINTSSDFEDLWDDGSGLAVDFLDERQYDMSWKSLSCRFDGDSSEFLRYERPNYAFGGPHLLKRRDAAKATKRFGFSDSPPTKHRKIDNGYDFVTSRGERKNSVGATNASFEDITELPDWSSFVLEDSRKSPSLLSEESCSSTAVRGEQGQS